MTVHSFFTVHMPWCTVQVLVLKKKKKKAQNVQTYQNVDVNVDPKPHLKYFIYVLKML